MRKKPKTGKKTSKLSIYKVLAYFLILSCTHHRDVVEGEDGIAKICIYRQTEAGSEAEANKQAHDFCQSREKVVNVIEQRTVLEKAYKDKAMKRYPSKAVATGLSEEGPPYFSSDMSPKTDLYKTEIIFSCVSK